jgi:hypothetical protein
VTQQVIHARVKLARVNEEDYIHPTFDFVFEQRGTNTSLNTADLTTMIANWFDTAVAGSGNPVGYYLSFTIPRAGSPHEILYYDITGKLDGTAAGGPIATVNFSITAQPPSTGVLALPDQIAVVVGYQGDMTGIPEFQGNTRPRSRRRGRVYVGPLVSAALANSATEAVVPAQMQTDLAVNTHALWNWSGQTAANNPQLVVWSRMDKAVYPCVQARVNNIHDVRRRRAARRIGTYITSP